MATCCWTDTNTNESYCQWCEVNTDTGEFENCSSPKLRPDSSIIAPPPSGIAPPPPTESCPENTARDAEGNCTPLTQTPEQPPTNQTPSPKGGPRNLLPEGVFEGPGTTPQQGETTPEVAPPTGPEGDNQTQSRINTSPTGYCVPIRSPTCIPCDPGLPGSTCTPGSDWPPASTGTPDTGTPEEAKPLVPPTTEETAPQVAPPPSTAVEEPVCPEGQELDEETGLCVLEEAPVTEQQEQPEEQEQSDQQDESN
jgi:hypothetical protein